MHKYSKNNASKAKRILGSKSEIDILGKALAQLIQVAASDPATDPEELDMMNEELEEILHRKRQEIRNFNAQVLLGSVFSRFHPDSWVHEQIEQMEESQLKNALIRHIQKGETYVKLSKSS